MDACRKTGFSVCNRYLKKPCLLTLLNCVLFSIVETMSSPVGSVTPGQSSKNPPTFSVPAVFDPVFYNTPDAQSLLLNAVASSADEEGFQSIICLHPRPTLPSHLGLPPLSNYEDKAFIQVAVENSPFIYWHQTPPTHAMQLTVTEYLILLQFVGNEWPRLHSKLQSQLITMREGTDPVFMSGHLMFYNHGASHFKVSISFRLTFRACVESRDPENKIKTWLERRSLPDASGNISDSSVHEMALPMNALTTLAQDTTGVKSLIDQMAQYKSRSRRRSKSVVS